MKVTIFIFITVSLLFISCKNSATESTNDTETFIEILYLTPEPESTITLNDSMFYFRQFLLDNPWYAKEKFRIAL